MRFGICIVMQLACIISRTSGFSVGKSASVATSSNRAALRLSMMVKHLKNEDVIQ